MLNDDDIRHVRAAEGWLELGLYADADQELDLVAPENRDDSTVLSVRCHICFNAARWPECLACANALLSNKPELPVGYTFASISLHKLGRTREAWELSRPVLDRFTDNWPIAYNLACYAAQLGEITSALELFEIALHRGDPAWIKLRALEDPDLKPIWSKIKQ